LKETERKTDRDGEWYAQRTAVRYLRVSQATLARWDARRGGRCPFLDNEGVRTRLFEADHDRWVTYYLKDDLDRILAAKAGRKPIPDYPGLVHVNDAARELGVSLSTLYRLQAAHGPSGAAVKKVGKSKNDKPLPRNYVSRKFVDACKASLVPTPLPAGSMSVK